MTGKELSRRSATNIGHEFTILPKNNMLAVTHQATIKFYKLDTLELHWETTPRYHIDDATTFTQVTDPSGPAYETEICVSGTLFETARQKIVINNKLCPVPLLATQLLPIPIRQ